MKDEETGKSSKYSESLEIKDSLKIFGPNYFSQIDENLKKHTCSVLETCWDQGVAEPAGRAIYQCHFSRGHMCKSQSVTHMTHA